MGGSGLIAIVRTLPGGSWRIGYRTLLRRGLGEKMVQAARRLAVDRCDQFEKFAGLSEIRPLAQAPRQPRGPQHMRQRFEQ